MLDWWILQCMYYLYACLEYDMYGPRWHSQQSWGADPVPAQAQARGLTGGITNRLVAADEPVSPRGVPWVHRHG